MKYLADADRKLITWIESLGRQDGKLPMSLDHVLVLLRRQNLALEKAVQRIKDTNECVFADKDKYPVTRTMNDLVIAEIISIMRGENG